jgi:hypothetical protein
MSLVGFRAPQSAEAARRNERGTRVRKGLGPFRKGLVVEVSSMKARITRIILTLSSVAMIALAGGASLRGF